jgi:hypothetical protein
VILTLAVAEIDPLSVGTTKVHALTSHGAGQAEAGDQKAARTSFQQAHLLIEKLQEEVERTSQAAPNGRTSRGRVSVV